MLMTFLRKKRRLLAVENFTRRCFYSDFVQRKKDEYYRLLLDGIENPKDSLAQRQAVDAALAGFSVFVHMPTGSGKSLAFQIPALLSSCFSKKTFIISPLVALMNDQVANLKRKGISAIQLSSGKRKCSIESQIQNAQIVYTTPEFWTENTEMRQLLQKLVDQNKLERLVIDEAHCILEWGNSFRPAYLELARWKIKYCEHVPVTFLTASISDDSIDMVANVFRLDRCVWSEQFLPLDPSEGLLSSSRAKQMVLIQESSDRANLYLQVFKKNQHPIELLHVIAAQVKEEPTIVYCLTRKEAEETCLRLTRIGCRAGLYHGGMPRKRREFVRKQWMGGRLSIICATSAFGMGIDRADVRFVIHHSLPLCLSSYYQQIGRAGRDGKTAKCLLFYAEQDRTRAYNLATCNSGDWEEVGSNIAATSSNHRHAIEEVTSFCETTGCRKELLYAHFGIDFHENQCLRNCNCGSSLEEVHLVPNTPQEDAQYQKLLLELDAEDASLEETSGDAVSKGQIEFYYQKILSETKKKSMKKREGLSRQVIQVILETKPSTIEEMAALRGVGVEKARMFFGLFSFERNE